MNNTTVLRGDVAEEVAELKRDIDGVILVAGSATLVQALVEHDLVDEIRLMVFPVVLGEGKQRFGPASAKKTMKLTSSQTVGEGISILVYQPVRD